MEKRRALRMSINVTIELKGIANTDGITDESLSVDVVNISQDGMAFTTSQILKLNGVYNTKVELWGKEKFDAVIEIVRMENKGSKDTLYGCRFVGITGADQFRIAVHEILSENDMLD